MVIKMITAKEILSLLEEVDIVKTSYNTEISLSINPASVSVALRELKDVTRTSVFKEDPCLRFLLDFKTGDLLVWVGYQAVHADVQRYSSNEALGGFLYIDTREVAMLDKGVSILYIKPENIDISKAVNHLCQFLHNYDVGEISCTTYLSALLLSLAARGDLQRIKKVVSLVGRFYESPEGFINVSDYKRRTPYYLAIQYGHQEVADYLKRLGGNSGRLGI